VPATWALSIRSPSVSTVSFVRIADALHCAERRERVWIPGHRVTAYHQGHRVLVRLPAHAQRLRVLACHPRVIRRHMSRNGRWVTKRIVLLPHRVAVNRLRVRFGRGALIRGWLGTPDGTALAGRVVRVLAAANYGWAHHFQQVATARTGPTGVWSARLSPGPSRIVVATYDGSATIEPSISRPARVIVPAAVRLRIRPRHVRWGATLRITGRVRGRDIPPAGEIVVLWAGWNGGSTEIGHVYTGRDGRFRTTYKFHRGSGRQTYRLWATSVRETDYPYAPGRSDRVRVTVAP
jgi:hypothetical protein